MFMPYFSTFNREVFVKHEQAQTAPRFEGVLTISYMAMFLKIKAFGNFFANFLCPKLSKGISTRRYISYEPICRLLRPSVTKKQPEKAHVSKTAVFLQFGHICIGHKTFHMSLLPGLYDHLLQRNTLEKPMF